MSGYLYGEVEPTTPCPYCGAECRADFCDIGVGYQQVGPYWCRKCHASEISGEQFPADDWREDARSNPLILNDGRCITQRERDTGWYLPETPADSLANTDQDGNIIRYFEADTLYRAEQGVLPRYDAEGKLLPS